MTCFAAGLFSFSISTSAVSRAAKSTFLEITLNSTKNTGNSGARASEREIPNRLQNVLLMLANFEFHFDHGDVRETNYRDL